jgi:N-methylhydantoinase B
LATFNLGGINQFGERFGLHLLDPQLGGSGAFATKDGIAGGGTIMTPMPCVADVERNEQWAPIRYLYRRIAPDSGGAGKKRGGCGVEIALSLSGIQSADALIMTHGLEVPNSVGLFGGWPGATVSQRFGRNVLQKGFYPSGVLPKDPAALGGDWEEFGPKPGLVPMGYQDVFATSWQGGGGWGDPLDRDPEEVLQDLDKGVITKRAAERIYGVVVKRGRLAQNATNERRQQIREQRIKRIPDSTGEASGAKPDWPLGEDLKLVKRGDQWEVLCRCGKILVTNSTRWRDGALARPEKPLRSSAPMKLHRDLTMTGFYCPSCARLLTLDIHEQTSSPYHDLLLDLASVEALEKGG